MTSEATRSKEINETGINKNKHPRFKQDVQEKPNDDGVENKSSSIPERTTQPLVKPQQSSIPFPNRKHKGEEDLAADHLSRVENPHMEVLTKREIADKFSDEHLMVLKSKFKDDEPWYADFVNYIVGKGDYEMWKLRIEQYFQVQDYALLDVIENGNSFKPVAQTTANADGTSTSTIPGLDAKTLFEAIQARFGGNDATKKTQKTLLKQMYENFNAPSTKSLPPEWNTHVVVWKNKPDLGTISFDDLYNNFKIVEQEVKRTVTSSSNTNSQNMAFISTPGSTNEVNTANVQVSTDSTPVSTAKEMYLKWQLALLSMRARRFYQRTGKRITINGSDTAGYDKSKVECFNCHKMGHFARTVLPKQWWLLMELVLIGVLWQMRNSYQHGSYDFLRLRGLAYVEEQLVFYKKNEMMLCDQIVVLKRDITYKDSDLSLFAPPTIDLSNSGLKEFQQPEFERYRFKTNKSVCENSSNEIKKTTDAPIIKDWVSDCNEDEAEVMVLKSDNVQHKPEQANQPKKINSVNTDKGNRVTSAIGEQEINVVKSSACWVWRPKIKTITIDTVNDGEQQLTVTVDGQTIAITKASVRRHLQLADADGISSLPNTEIFDQLTLMGYVSNDDKLTFQKGGHTHGSDEGSKKLNELIELCTKLSDKVTSLEDDLKQTKKIYSKAQTKLVKKVKQLEAKLKCTIERRKARMVISDDEEDLVSEDTSKHVRMTETEYEEVEIDLNQTDDDLQRRSIIEEIDLAKILTDASRERVKTYTRRRSTDSLRDSTARGLFSTAEENTVVEQVQERYSDTIKRYQTLKKKPVSVAQARKNMLIYLKNMAGYKMGYFKGISYDKIRPIFEEGFKKLRIAEALRSEPIQEQPTEEPKELSEEELKKMLEIVPVEEIKAEALQVKYPIIDWEIHTEGLRKY
ncbi:putative ribonuclease H-like domain-containing protein [Tanacetum coccineum]